MLKRYVAIGFRHLLSDWLVLRRPELTGLPFVFVTPEHGRLMITAASEAAQAEGIQAGMKAADAKALVPGLKVIDDKPGRSLKLLKGLGEWCIRYSPFVSVDYPFGLILDVSGCTHLWGGEDLYLKEIVSKLKSKGYHVRAAMADTIGTAWAVSRFGQGKPIVESAGQAAALLPLPPSALRLEPAILQKLQKLGFYQIKSFVTMPRSVLRRRFGDTLLLRLGQALGQEDEPISPIQIVQPYQERLPCLEPIKTAKGIEIAIQRLLEVLCKRLQEDGKGIRSAILKCFRIDGKVEQVAIGTNQATHSTGHLFKLLELKIPGIAPALGIELFILEALKTEDVEPVQEALWKEAGGDLNDLGVAELLDRLAGKFGIETIHRYLPDEHYWPERSIKPALSLHDKPTITWSTEMPRPVQLLAKPERVEVAAPIPDYPPIAFRYKNKAHYIKKADGPERIEREWWLDTGEHRDYYIVEDEDGKRYWLFRSGHYQPNQSHLWYLHGFFA